MIRKVSFLLLLILMSCALYGQEICTDGKDNDMDGFIDFYDEDCDCDNELFNAQCPIECIDTSDSTINIALKWKTKILNNATDFRLHNIAVLDNTAFINTHRSIAEGIENSIVEIDLLSQDISTFATLDTLAGASSNDFMIYRNSKNDPISLITKNSNNELTNYNKANGLIWRSSNIVKGFSRLKYIKSADLNEDGVPEIYTGSSIINSDGKLLFQGASSEGCNFVNSFDLCSIGANSIASDFTNHQGLELACGNVLYEIDINNTTDSIGNTVNVITAPPAVLDGYTGMGDFDGDRQLEIISSRGHGNNDGGLWIWNPRDQTLLASSLHSNITGGWGGVPTVADINNDCIPEIIVILEDALRVYRYDGTNVLELFYEKIIEDNSGYTIPTVFDLNSDGVMEIIFRDEEFLFVLDGPTGDILSSFPIGSKTANEQPIITDTDNDGHAEILIQGTDTHPDSLRLFCFESANLPWAQSRRVWNQYGYHVTNVNDDLTIPQYQQNSAAFFDTDSCYLETCPQVYNTFGIQATYRTQKGCQVFDEFIPEFENTILSFENCDSIVAMISVTSNLDNISWFPELNVDCTDCAMVTIKSDTAISIIVVAESETCRISDTLFFELQSQEIIETVENICFGDSILFNDEYKLETGTYSYTSVTCDTSYILDLVVRDSIYSNIQQSICAGDSIEFGNDFLKEEGEYQTILPSATGCDSTISLSLQVNSVENTNEVFPICQGDSVLIESTWYFGGETLEIMESTTEGCDSIISLTIEVVDLLSDEEVITFCEGDSMLLHNQWVKDSGEYPELFEAQSGCDSVFTYIVTTTPFKTATIIRQICEGDSLVIDTEIFKTEGIFEITSELANGCDSITTLNLFVLTNSASSLDMELCFGDSVLVDEQWVYESGAYETTLENAEGCDSIITLNLDVLDNSSGNSEMQICLGDSIFLDNQWIYESGEYEINLQNADGCDSIVSVSVTELPLELVADSLVACNGDSILFSGEYYFSNQVISDTLWDEACPKLRNTELSFVDLLSTEESIMICQGDTIVFGEIQIFEAGAYPLSFLSGSGCDSVHTINVTTLEHSFSLPSDTLLKDGNNYEYLVDVDTSIWSVSWISDDVVIDCESCLLQSWNISGNSGITLQIFSGEGCEVSHTFQVNVAESDEFVYPNIFTPNGDGFNDEWIIDMSKYPVNKLLLFDRWGDLLLDQENVETISWDGRFQNSEVQPGVYVFILEYTDLEGVTQWLLEILRLYGR